MSKFQDVSGASSFRRMASAMWGRPNDPSIYGSVDIDATNALALIARYRTERDTKLTITHLVARAMALTLKKNPEVNAKVRFWTVPSNPVSGQ